MCSNHRPVHLLLNFSTQGNVICHDKHIIHSSIMHPVTFFPTVEYRERGEKKNPSCFIFFLRFSHSSCQALWKKEKKTHRSEWTDVKMHFTSVECICSWSDNNGPENTRRPQRSCPCSGNGVGPQAWFAGATP